MSIPRDWPPRGADRPVAGIARFKARCTKCDTNDWLAVAFSDGIGWACIKCGDEDTDHPRVAIPEGDRTEEDL